MDDLGQYDWLIWSIARKFYNVEREDLYQAGCLGLIKAYKNYNNPDVVFSEYAKKYIFGEMYELSVKSRNIKLNKYYLKVYKLVTKARAYLTQELGRTPSIKDISAYLEEDEVEIQYIVSLMENMFSLDDEEANIQVGSEESIDEEIIWRDMVNSLDPLSSAVIDYRYNKDLTQSEVAKLLGISQVKVSRIESKSKNKMLEYIA